MNQQTIVGLLLVLLLTFVWVAEAELTQYILSNNSNFNRPLFLRLSQQAFLVVYIPFVYFKTKGLGINRKGFYDLMHKFGKSAAVFAVLYLLMGYIWFASLSNSRVATNTTLYQTYILFSFLLSAVWLNEKIKKEKVLAALVSFAGVCLVSFSAADDGVQDSFFGIVLVLISAFLYSVVQVGYARWIEPKLQNSYDTLLFTGMQGLAIFAIMPVLLVVAHISGFEELSWPPFWIWIAVIGNGCVALIYMPSMLFAISQTSPTFVAVACTISIPMSMLADVALSSASFGWGQGIGSALVMIGLGLMATSLKSYREVIEEQVV